jgi:SAM-dependent MidA family methyltransferase
MSETISEIIRAEIGAHGPMPFRRFMELALYHPTLGYYGSGRARIGRKGDFFTNVSVGPIFGRLLALQVSEMWTFLGSPAEFSIAEQGAHEGHLAADLLGGLREFAPECLAATTYRIVEPSPVLAAGQRERLAAWGSRVRWTASLAETEIGTGVHLSNELPDAFPVHLIVLTRDGWRERMVIAEQGRFAFVDGPLGSEALRRACAQISGPLAEGYVTEVNLAARDWIGDVAARLRRGFVLAVDYGFSREDYYAPSRTSGTLAACANHRRESDPLARPGEIDLTAHVDFTSLIEAGESAGLRMLGFTDQHHFTVGLGLRHFADGRNANERRAFQTLMHPEFMGQAFKAVCFAKGLESLPSLSGFRFGGHP